MQPRTISVAAASRSLGVGKTKFYQLLAAGQIRSFLLGRRRLIVASDIDDFVARLLAERR